MHMGQGGILCSVVTRRVMGVREEFTLVLLEGRGLSKRFGGVMALDQVTFSVDEGTVAALIGPNGAGKTTLFNVVAGALKPDSGEILFAGEEITGMPANATSRLGLARTFQVTRPFATMTCLENVGVAVVNSPRSGANGNWRPSALRYLEVVGLSELAHSEARQLNVVQKKRLEIARALATRPQLLMLDEVLGGLNSQEIVQAIDFIRRLRDEHHLTVFWIEHVMGAVMQAADKVIVLDQGRRLMEGTPEQVVKDPRVIHAYLGD
jgi:branched-chain amino acid transport system ATP-binding protein